MVVVVVVVAVVVVVVVFDCLGREWNNETDLLALLCFVY